MAIYSKFLSLIASRAETVDLSSNTLSLAAMQLNGSTSGAVTHKASAITTNHTLTWPAANAAGLLTNDGSGNLSWASAPATGANTALSNLASVAINTSLLPGVNDSIDLGSASFAWRTLFAYSLAFPSGPAISLQNGQTFDSSGAVSVDWASRVLDDSSGVASVDYGSRALKDSAAATQLSWTTSGVAFNQLTATTVPYLNGSKVLTSSSVTPTELGYVSGVTSAIQTQLAAKLALAGGTMTGAINLGGFTPTNSGTPVNPSDLVTKSYVDNFINATSWKTAALVASTGSNLTLSGEQTIDGILTSTSRVLVKDQTTASQNGIYVTASGAWSRAVDMATWAEVPAAAIFVESGTINSDLGFVCISQPGGTIGTTAINFVQFSSAGSYSADGITLQLISGVFSVKSAGITETQIASSAISTTGALNGGSGTKLSVRVDNSTLDISGSNNLEIKAGGVSATQLATGAFDQVTITGGAGTAASVSQAPSLKRTLVAGQTFTANTSYAVRWGLTANGETAGRVYAADITTTSFDLFNVIGMASSAAGASAGGSIVVTTLGSFSLSSSDTAFASGTDGSAVYLTASGTFSVTAPTSAASAVTKIGIVQLRSATAASNIIDVMPAFMGIN